LASCLGLQGRKQESAEMLTKSHDTRALVEKANKMLRAESDSPTRDAASVFEIGSILLQIGETRLGLHWLHQALNRDPNHQPTHKLLAEHYQSHSDEQKASFHRSRLRDSVSINPKGSSGPNNSKVDVPKK